MRWRPAPMPRRIYVRRVFLSMISGWQTQHIGGLWARAFGDDRQTPGLRDLMTP